MDEKKLPGITTLSVLVILILFVLGGGIISAEFKRYSIKEPAPLGTCRINYPRIPVGNTDLYKSGESLFKKNCMKCHLIDRKMTGPALMFVTSRWADTADLYLWIKDSQRFLQSGDNYAKDLFVEYNSIMPAFSNLSDTDITAILYYVRHYPLNNEAVP